MLPVAALCCHRNNGPHFASRQCFTLRYHNAGQKTRAVALPTPKTIVGALQVSAAAFPSAIPHRATSPPSVALPSVPLILAGPVIALLGRKLRCRKRTQLYQATSESSSIDKFQALKLQQEKIRQAIKAKKAARRKVSEDSLWQKVEHPESPGQFYYYNRLTGETAWEIPAAPAATAQEVSDEEVQQQENAVSLQPLTEMEKEQDDEEKLRAEEQAVEQAADKMDAQKVEEESVMSPLLQAHGAEQDDVGQEVNTQDHAEDQENKEQDEQREMQDTVLKVTKMQQEQVQDDCQEQQEVNPQPEGIVKVMEQDGEQQLQEMEQELDHEEGEPTEEQEEEVAQFGNDVEDIEDKKQEERREEDDTLQKAAESCQEHERNDDLNEQEGNHQDENAVKRLERDLQKLEEPEESSETVALHSKKLKEALSVIGEVCKLIDSTAETSVTDDKNGNETIEGDQDGKQETEEEWKTILDTKLELLRDIPPVAFALKKTVPDLSDDSLSLLTSSQVKMLRIQLMKAHQLRLRRLARQQKILVFLGRVKHTAGGLTSDDLMVTKKGKVVSKKQYAATLKWTEAIRSARNALDIQGFVPIGGSTPQGQKLYKKAKELYYEMQRVLT